MTSPEQPRWFWNLVSKSLHWRDRLHARLIERDGLILGVLVVVALVGVGVYFKGKPLYLRWKSAQAVSQAREFIRRNETENAQIALQVAFSGGATIEAYIALADFLEQAESVEAVEIRRVASGLAPDDSALKLAVVATALRFNDTAAARAALAACTPAEKNTEAYLRAASAYALIAGEYSEALQHLSRLREMVGATPELRLLRSAVQVNDARPGIAAAARRDLQNLARDPAQRLAALRVLIAHALSRRDAQLAGETAAALGAEPTASFADWLNAAAAEKMADPAAENTPALAQKIQQRAESVALAAVQYSRWLMARSGVEAARAWLDQLKPEFLQTSALRAIRGEVATLQGDWATLRRLLAGGAWGTLSPAGIEFAFAARLSRALKEPELAHRVWLQALEETKTSASGLRALAHLAEAWSWPEAKRAALFLTVRQFRNDTVAFLQLAKDLRAQRDTRGLRDLYQLFDDGSERYESKRQDWALLTLLVSPATGVNEATQTLHAMHRKRPANAYFATNHALALCQLKKDKEAAALIDGLSALDRNVAERAPYVAFIYASAGRKDEARAALRRAPPPAALLPEEAALLAKATALVGR